MTGSAISCNLSMRGPRADADPRAARVAWASQRPVLASRFTQWELLLANSTAASRVRIIVSPRWQQKCLERLIDPDNKRIGHRILWHTGAMSRYPVPPGAKPLRTIHMTHDAYRAAPAMAARAGVPRPELCLDQAGGARRTRFRNVRYTNLTLLRELEP